MEMLMEYMATYRHGTWWLVDVYREAEAENYWVFLSNDEPGEIDTKDALHPEPYKTMPTWQEAKWFYDHAGD